MTSTITPILSIFVPGIPASKGSSRAILQYGPTGPKALNVPSGSNKNRADQKAWAHAVTLLCQAAWRGRPPINEACSVEIVFHLPRPKTRARELWCATTPDIDKLARCTLDALQAALVVHDDSRISQLTLSKVWATDTTESGADISIAPLTGETL